MGGAASASSAPAACSEPATSSTARRPPGRSASATARRSSRTAPSPRRRSRSAAYYAARGRRSRRGDRDRARIPVVVRGRSSCGRSQLSESIGGRRVGRRLPRGVGPCRLQLLTRVLGDFELAEDAVQDAFTTALERWPRDGMPAQPGRLDRHRRPQPRDRPAPPRADARRARPSCSPGSRQLPGRGGRRELDPRRPARARLHLLPPRARRGVARSR